PSSTAMLDPERSIGDRRGGVARREAVASGELAEREGFEPSTRLLDVYTISSRAPSATRTPLRIKVAEGVGFEPTWELITPNSISSRARYDHFGTPPHAAVGRTPASGPLPHRRRRRPSPARDHSTPPLRPRAPGSSRLPGHLALGRRPPRLGEGQLHERPVGIHAPRQSTVARPEKASPRARPAGGDRPPPPSPLMPVGSRPAFRGGVAGYRSDRSRRR